MKCSFLGCLVLVVCLIRTKADDDGVIWDDGNHDHETFGSHHLDDDEHRDSLEHPNDSAEDSSGEYEQQSWSRPYNRGPNSINRPQPNNYGRPSFSQNNGYPTQAPVNNGNPNYFSGNLNGPPVSPNPSYFGGNPSLNGPNYNRPQGYPYNNGMNTNIQNPNFNGYGNGNYPNGRPTGGNGNQFGSNINGNGGDCSRSTIGLPSPQTGCCGREAIQERNNGQNQNGYMNRPANNQMNRPGNRQWPYSSYPGRFTRDTETDANDTLPDITLDNRIAGGKETSLLQFPWTVFLKTTFDYGTRKASFNCGGSLISSRLVLTAAHCVSEDDARVSNIDINLAEYDKRTFPRDCVYVPGQGRQCIDNVVMEAEDIFPHPQYDSIRLQNDIALIRLRGSAPYTEFIRPICLPPINVDNPQYSDLRLAVAGWGRNGTATSSVKQSTVINLVPQRECSMSYPHLTEKHLCAAGHSGEDTCKGDSGGPLMMLYEGQYYVSGVVSGKRADSPCGTNVPSLYTNVYHYIDWISRYVGF